MLVLYFGKLSEICGKKSEELNFTGTVGDLRKHLVERYPEIRQHPFGIAVNHAMAADEQSLEGVSEVALLPPFTGG